jgi:hypothetical protein
VEPFPDELSPRRLRLRLAELAGVVAVIGIIVLAGPCLGELRTRLAHASVGWLLAASRSRSYQRSRYVVIFRAVFCPTMGWRLSCQIGMSEKARTRSSQSAAWAG